MNCSSETARMGVPRAAQALAPRAGQPQGVDPKAYLNGMSQGELVLIVVEGAPEDARKYGHIIRARCAPLSPTSGFSVSWSQQVIHERSGLALSLSAACDIVYYLHSFACWHCVCTHQASRRVRSAAGQGFTIASLTFFSAPTWAGAGVSLFGS